MAIIAEVNTPALVAANYHRADLSEVRLADGKAHVKVLSYRDKQARLAGAEHLARQILTIDFDMKSNVPAIEQIYAGIKAALGHDARDDIDEVGAYLRENAQATSSALRAAMLASSHAAQQEREALAATDEHKFPAPHEKLTDWDVVGVGDASGTIPSDIANKLAGIGMSPKAGETMPAFTARLRAHYNDIAGKRHAGIGDIPVIDAEMEIISVVLNELIALTPKVGG